MNVIVIFEKLERMNKFSAFKSNIVSLWNRYVWIKTENIRYMLLLSDKLPFWTDEIRETLWIPISYFPFNAECKKNINLF